MVIHEIFFILMIYLSIGYDFIYLSIYRKYQFMYLFHYQ